MTNAPKKGWMARLKEGLSRSSNKLTGGITDLFTKRKLDHEALDELEEILITGDLGVETAMKICEQIARTRFGKEVSPEEIREAVAEQITPILEPVAKPLEVNSSNRPHIILVCGVNGSGKTTTIGKMTKQFQEQGKSVMMAAGDTFRAAAVEQLKVWGERNNCPVVARETGADAAGLVYDAIEQAKATHADILIIDTAGRLQNKSDLMAELEKVIRVIRKLDENAPHDCLLVLDATVGQNAHSQVDVFKKIVDVTGLVLTKLDGTAKGGVLIALADKFGLPVHAIGVGEGIDDLKPFKAQAFARNLMGLED